VSLSKCPGNLALVQHARNLASHYKLVKQTLRRPSGDILGFQATPITVTGRDRRDIIPPGSELTCIHLVLMYNHADIYPKTRAARRLGREGSMEGLPKQRRHFNSGSNGYEIWVF
jgi:hypothetical protein